MSEASEVNPEIDDLDEASEIIPFNFAITAYGADYPVDAIVKRINEQDIVIPRFTSNDLEDSDFTGFQREYVWPRTKADKFIESLLLGLPVPGIFLVKEKTGRFLVLDGQQRLFTLHAFCTGIINKQEYRLTDVQPRFDGQTYKELDTEDRRRLDDAIIHATVVRQDEPTNDQSSIYIIFERLNSGGVSLQPQEIRVALYHGEFATLLRKLNTHDSWRTLYGAKSSRLKDIEMILRFFAFQFYRHQYRSPMKDFLNRYMASNRSLNLQSEAALTSIFKNTTDFLNSTLGSNAFRPVRAINAAVVDSLLVGTATRLQKGPITDLSDFSARYNALLEDKTYRDSIETGTSQEANVETRISKAIEAFKDTQ